MGWREWMGKTRTCPAFFPSSVSPVHIPAGRKRQVLLFRLPFFPKAVTLMVGTLQVSGVLSLLYSRNIVIWVRQGFWYKGWRKTVNLGPARTIILMVHLSNFIYFEKVRPFSGVLCANVPVTGSICCLKVCPLLQIVTVQIASLSFLHPGIVALRFEAICGHAHLLAIRFLQPGYLI